VEGIMSPGGWNQNVSPEAKDFYDKFLAMFGIPPDNWSMAFGYGTYQIYEQAIEKVGLDRTKLRDYIATHTFQTVYGPIKFTDFFNKDHASYVGQWQKGTFESVAPKKNRKVVVEYPKPPWP
jgi:ABC-type branched-subunit amino acid transport system substrate-binding protein